MPKILMVFLKYKNPKDIFTKGTILYDGKEVLQVINDDGLEWGEIKLITYSDNQSYNDDINDFNKVKNELVNYRVILAKYNSKLKLKFEKMKLKIKTRILSDDTSFNLAKKERPSQRRLRTAGSAPNMNNGLKMRTQYKGRPIYLVNLIKYHDIAQYPEGYEGKKVSGKKAFAKYGRIAVKYNKKHKNYVKFSGVAKSTIADNTGKETKWNMVAIVKYDSRESMQKFTSETAFKQGIEHKDASLEATYVYACIME
jgi:hypothetical protein